MPTALAMQGVQAALANLDARMVQVVGDVAEARREVKEAKDSLEAGGQQLQRDLGTNIAQAKFESLQEMAKFKFEAHTEFEKQQK